MGGTEGERKRKKEGGKEGLG